MVHYMSSYLGICLKLSGTQGPTGFKNDFQLADFVSKVRIEVSGSSDSDFGLSRSHRPLIYLIIILNGVSIRNNY